MGKMMTTTMKMGGGVCVLALATVACFGQSKPSDEGSKTATAQNDGRHYQMVFIAKEVEDGKVVNARRYETDISFAGPDGGFGMIKAGRKIPVATGSYDISGKLGQETQFTYLDVGVNVDIRHARLEGDRVSLEAKVEVSGVDPVPPDSTHPADPIVRQNVWTSHVTVPLGKPTVIFSSDDVSSKRTTQIELTVTPVR